MIKFVTILCLRKYFSFCQFYFDESWSNLLFLLRFFSRKHVVTYMFSLFFSANFCFISVWFLNAFLLSKVFHYTIHLYVRYSKQENQWWTELLVIKILHWNGKCDALLLVKVELLCHGLSYFIRKSLIIYNRSSSNKSSFNIPKDGHARLSQKWRMLT